MLCHLERQRVWFRNAKEFLVCLSCAGRMITGGLKCVRNFTLSGVMDFQENRNGLSNNILKVR